MVRGKKTLTKLNSINKTRFGVAGEIYRILNSRERKVLILSLGGRVGLVTLDLIGIILIGAVVSLFSGTTIAPSSMFGSWLVFLEKAGFANPYLFLISVAVSFFIAKGAIAVVLNRIISKFIAKIEASKSTDLFRNILVGRENVEFSSTAERTLFTLTESVTAATTKAILVGSTIVGEVALLLAISTFLAITDFWLFCSVTVFFVSVGIVMHRFITLSSGLAWKELQDANLSSQALAMDLLLNLRQVRLSPNRDTYVDLFSSMRSQFSAQNAKHQNISSLPRYITELAVLLGIGILVFQRTLFDPGIASASVIAIFLAGIFRIVSAMLPLQSALTVWKSVEIQATFSLEQLKTIPSPELRTRHKNSSRRNPWEGTEPLSVSIKNLTFQYPKAKEPVLSGINLEIKPGSFVAIAGKSGSGKSTLADLLIGLKRPTTGQILINGASCENFIEDNLGVVAYVPQEPSLLAATLGQNVSLNFGKQDQFEVEQVRRSLEVAGLSHLLHKLPNGLETQIGPGYQTLSGGEVQRIGIARAIFTEPSLLILDEATSALDSETQQEIMESIFKLRQKMTLIVIAHRKETIASADLVVVLDA